jgi:hypothetical protein
MLNWLTVLALVLVGYYIGSPAVVKAGHWRVHKFGPPYYDLLSSQAMHHHPSMHWAVLQEAKPGSHAPICSSSEAAEIKAFVRKQVHMAKAYKWHKGTSHSTNKIFMMPNHGKPHYVNG